MFAIGIHIIVLVLSGFFTSSDSKRNLIDVQFGSFSSGGNRTSSASSGSVQEKKTSTRSKMDNTLQISSGDSKGEESSSGSGEGGIGNSEASSFGFNESVANFREPTYPRLAIKRGLEGEVKVKMTISAEGDLLDVVLIKSSGHEILDSAAMAAAKNWRFQKRSKVYSVEKNILFKLRG